MNEKCEAVLPAAATLAEGPHWDDRSRRLLWVDILGKRVGSFDPANRRNHSLPLDTLVGAVVPTARGDWMVAVQTGFARLDPASGRLSDLIEPEGHDPKKVRFNDGKCDCAGRFWAGSMSLDDTPDLGALYCLEPGGRVRWALSGVSISNGLAWSLDQTRMYYIDTPTSAVTVFDDDPDAGILRNRRVAFPIAPDLGFPDGMTIDAEGMLWIALWDGGAVTRWDPASGRMLARIELPVSRVTSCAFGGPDLGTLFITTARFGLSAEDLARQPQAGSIFAVETPAPGVPSFSFRG